MIRARGRPARDQAMPSRAQMLAGALQHLQEGGIAGFTMRGLATRLGVSAMTIHHHFGGREGLIKALADQVYAGVAVPEQARGRAGIEALLRAYHACVLRHPELTLLIFNGPEVFPEQARRITAELAGLLAETGLAPGKAALWLGILVDFTHGAAIATAMAGRDGRTEASAEYAEALAELVSALPRG